MKNTTMREAAHLADIRIDDEGWQAVIPDLDAACDRTLAALFATVDRAPAPLGVLFTDDAAVRALNARYRDQDKPTNVLSFPADPDTLPPDQKAFLGDLVLARETVEGEAAMQGKTVAAHTDHLVVHGVLHLLGHDHVDPAAAEVMETLERAILERLGYGDPYDDMSEAGRQ